MMNGCSLFLTKYPDGKLQMGGHSKHISRTCNPSVIYNDVEVLVPEFFRAVPSEMQRSVLTISLELISMGEMTTSFAVVLSNNI